MRITFVRQTFPNLTRHFTRCAAALLAAGCALLVLPARAQIGEPTPGAYTNMLAQIGALKAEAAALTPAQKKLSSTLMEAVRENRGIGPRRFAPQLRSGLKPLAGGRMLVDIKAKVSAELLKTIRSLGGTMEGSFPQYNAVQAELPLDALETVASSPDVISIRPLLRPRTNVGTATSEGDVAHQANLVRSTYGVTGAGVKVGVMSDSDRYITQSQANGDLGQVTVLDSGQGVGNDTGEGTAMMEIVHDLAPNAQLYFASGEHSKASMASNIIALADAGCAIIIDDLTYADEPPFQDGIISQAVQTVSGRGVLYFSSAANIGNFDSGTASVWEGDFRVNAAGDLRYGTGPLHNWGSSVYNLLTNLPAGGADVTLYWADPLGARTNIYNLFITDNSGNVLVTGLSYSDGPKDPIIVIEGVTNRPGGQYIVVELATGNPVYIRVDVDQDNCKLGIGTPGSTRGHNASPAPNAFCVAATTAKNRTTAFTAGAESVELFSCDGYRRMFFYADGTPITGGNYSSSGGQVFYKPDITAADGTLASTGTFPSNSVFASPFFGTSAAAPHAGAIAALLKSYRPGLDAGSIRTALVTTALDIEASGSDRDSGAGIVMANRALSSLLDTNSPVATITYPLNGSTITASGFAPFTGTAVESPSGVASVTGILTYHDPSQGYLYWNGTAYQTSSATLSATLNGTNWTISNLPGGGNFKNGSYAFSVSAASGTVPAVVGTSVTVNFIVDYHQVYTWTAGSYYETPGDPNPNSDWFNPANWDLGSVPPADALAAIGTATPSPTSDNPITVYGLTMGANALTTPSLTVTQLNLVGSTLNAGVLNINIGGVFGFYSGTFTGTCLVPAGATLNFNGFDNIYLSGSIIQSSGTINWSGAGQINMADDSSITSGGTFNLQSDATFFNYTGGSPQFTNNGVMIKTAGTNSMFSPDNSGVAVNNRGTISVQSGTLFLGGGGTWTNANSTAASGCHLELIGGNFEFDGLQTFGGAGSVRVNGGAVTFGGGTNTMTNGGTFEVLAGSVLGGSTFNGTGTFNWLGGTINANLGLQPNVSFNLGGGDNTKYFAGGTFVSAGPGTWTGTGQWNVADGSAFINNGNFNVQSDAAVFNYTGGSPVFINNGTFRKTAGVYTAFLNDNNGLAFNNNGTINVQSGTLALGGGGTGSGGTFIAATNCHIDLNGGTVELDGNLTFSGAGSTRFNGSVVTLGGGSNTLSSGTLEIMTGGSLGGSSIFGGTGSFNWSGGNLGASINLHSTNINLNISGADMKYLTTGGNLISSGAGTWTGTGQWNVADGSAFINNGNFNVQNDATVFNYTGGSPVFINNGTYLKTSGTNTIFAPDNNGVAFNNNGTINVQSGTLALGGSGTGSGGTFIAATNCHIDLNGGTVELDGNLTFSGTGSTRFNGSIVTLGGGSNTLSSGTLEIMTGGSLGGGGIFGGTGSFNWSGGIITGGINVPSTNIGFNLCGTDGKYLAGGLIACAGSNTWTGTGNFNVGAGSAFTNNGIMNVQSDAAVFNFTGGLCSFVNNGVFLKTAGTNTSFLPDNNGMFFNNNGTISVLNGILSLNASGVLAATASLTLRPVPILIWRAALLSWTEIRPSVGRAAHGPTAVP